MVRDGNFFFFFELGGVMAGFSSKGLSHKLSSYVFLIRMRW